MRLKRQISEVQERGLLEWVEQAAVYPKKHPKEHEALAHRLKALEARLGKIEERLTLVEQEYDKHSNGHVNITIEDGAFLRKLRKSLAVPSPR